MKYQAAIILLLIFNNAVAQTDSVLIKAKHVDAFENIFVHTDKNNYVSGETIWLKAYLYDGLYPSDKSSSIKIQLIRGDSSIVTEKVYPVVSGIAVGNINLQTSLSTGRYFIKAIGNAAVNKQSSQCYIAPVLINNPATAQKIDTVAYKSVPSVQFSCPGGLVAGLPNQAFVSVTDQYKQPIQTAGFLLDAKKDTVASFNTNSLGTGELDIIPAPNEKYTIALSGGIAEPYDIPSSSIQQRGVAMTVYYRKGTYNVVLNATEDAAAEDYDLVAEYNYNLLAKVKVHFNNNGAVIKIPAVQLPAGINRFTLLNKYYDAVCERYVFSTNITGLIDADTAVVNLNNIDTAISNVGFAVRDTAETTISVSAVDSDYDFGNIYKDENIVNRFLLTGYFKEYNPAFSGLIDDLEKADVPTINILLATRQLLKPSWQKIKEASINTPAEKIVYSHINIKGIVTPDGYKNLPKKPSLEIILSGADSSRSFSVVPLASDGTFEMDDLIFGDSITLYYQLAAKIPSPVKLNVEATDPFKDFDQAEKDWNFMQGFVPIKAVNITETQTKAIENEKKLLSLAEYSVAKNELANVTVHSIRSLHQKTKEVEERYTSSMFARESSQEFDLINNPYYTGAQSVVDYLRLFGRRMMVPRKNSGGAIQQVGGFMNNKVYYTLFLDEGQVSVDALEGVPLSEVALIKVYDNGFVMSSLNTGGPAIAIYTRKGSDRVMPGIVHMQKVKVAGYSATEDFQNADTQSIGKINKQKLLSTFYWNPYVSTNKLEPGNIKFLNINSVKKAVFTIQGMGSDGKLLYYKQIAVAK